MEGGERVLCRIAQGSAATPLCTPGVEVVGRGAGGRRDLWEVTDPVLRAVREMLGNWNGA